MAFIIQGKTNIKYILIVLILAALLCGGILAYQYWWLPKHEIKIPGIAVQNQTVNNNSELLNFKYYPYNKDTLSRIDPDRREVIFIYDSRGDGQIVEVPRKDISKALRKLTGFTTLFPKFLPQNIILSPLGARISGISEKVVEVQLNFVKDVGENLSESPTLFLIIEGKNNEENLKIFEPYMKNENKITIGNINGYKWTGSRENILFVKDDTWILIFSDSKASVFFPEITNLGTQLITVAASME